MSYKIHPGIGVARIGDSPDSFDGPEQPGLTIAPAPGFRDADCRILRQNAVFRVFEHVGDTATEVVPSATTTIRWAVRFAVKRDFTQPNSNIPWVDAEMTIDAPGTKLFPPSPAHPIVEVKMLASGRLLVRSAIYDPLHANFDSGDRCEGYVHAKVITALGTTSAAASWVIITQPDYAPGLTPTSDAATKLLSLWPGAPPTSPTLPLTDLLDRGPLSYLGPTGWDLDKQLDGLLQEHFVEPLRFVAGGPPYNLRNATFEGWTDDLAAGCDWSQEVSTDTSSSPTLARGRNWKLRGFLARQPDSSVKYVDWCPEVGGPSSIDFYQVPQGSERAVPIALTLKNFPAATKVTSAISGASSLTLSPATWTTPTIDEDKTEPKTIWATLKAGNGAALGAITGKIELDFAGHHSLSIKVHGEIVKPEPTGIALVLDCSASMDESRGDSKSRLEGLKDAVSIIVDVARPGDSIAVAPFSDDALPTLHAKKLGTGDDDDESASGARGKVRAFVNALHTVGETSIGAGLESAQGLLQSFTDPAIIVVSDGFQNHDPMIEDVSVTKRTFAVGIGPAFEPALRELTLNHDGFTTVVGDPVSNNNRYKLEKYLLAILSGATNGDTILDPEGRVFPGNIERLPFPVSEADLGLDLSVVSDHAGELLLGIEGPNGEVASFQALKATPGTRVTRRSRLAHIALSVPLRSPSSAAWGPGTWTLLLACWSDRADSKDQERLNQLFGTAVTRRHREDPVSYAAIVNTTTALRLRADLFPKGDGLLLEASVARAGAPLERQPHIGVELTGPLGHKHSVPLLPDASGVHRALFPSVRPGRYVALFRAVGTTHGHAYQRERTIEDLVGTRDGRLRTMSRGRG